MLVMLAGTGIGATRLTDTPLSNYPAMEFASIPAYQKVARNQIFTQEGWVKDQDTYLTNGEAGTEHLVTNTSVDVKGSIQSGTVKGVNNSLIGGKCTRIYVIQSVVVEGVYYDTFTFRDLQSSPVVKDEDKISVNRVLIQDPDPSRGGGAGGGR